MKYPIDTEKYIEAMQMELGPSKAAEEAHRIVIPLVNSAYQDGLSGEGGYPEDPERMLAGLSGEWGREPTERICKMVRRITQWRNAAYQEGHRDVEGARA